MKANGRKQPISITWSRTASWAASAATNASSSTVSKRYFPLMTEL